MFQLPWNEISIIVPLIGALFVSRIRDPNLACRCCLVFAAATFGCTFLTWLGFYIRHSVNVTPRWELMRELFGRQFFTVDNLSAPLVPMVALLHFLTTLATARTKMGRFRFASSLASEAIVIATFSANDPWLLIGLLAIGTVPPYLELLHRAKPTRVYVLHMGLFIALMVTGWAFVEWEGRHAIHSAWATLPLLAAILVRSGTVPVHCWLTDLFEHSSFGTALLFVAPLTGVYAAVPLVLPIAPGGVLRSIGLISLATAVYAAGLAVVQREARRLFACLFLSHASLVLVGMELVTSISLTGALCLWFSVAVSLGGFGLSLRALEARFGRLSLTHFHGLYEHSPTLAVCFLLTGLASVGFPGTMGFVSAELLVDGAVEANLFLGLAVVVTAALNGIAVVRAYFLLFTGTRHASSVSLQIGLRERVAVLTLAGLILGGGIFPQPGVSSRHDGAEEILDERAAARHTPKHEVKMEEPEQYLEGGE